MPGYSWSNPGKDYRYGYNGMLEDNEVYGDGEAYTAESWEYDSRLGRRWNIDPAGFNDISNYACLHNNPNYFIDPDGNEPISPEESKKDDSESIGNKLDDGQGRETTEVNSTQFNFHYIAAKNQSQQSSRANGGPDPLKDCFDFTKKGKGGFRLNLKINWSWLIGRGVTYQRATEFDGLRSLSPVVQPAPGGILNTVMVVPGGVQPGQMVFLNYNAFTVADIFTLTDQNGNNIPNPNDIAGTGATLQGQIPIPAGTTSINLNITPAAVANRATSQYNAQLVLAPRTFVYGRKYISILGIKIHYGKVTRFRDPGAGINQFPSGTPIIDGRTSHRNAYNRQRR